MRAIFAAHKITTSNTKLAIAALIAATMFCSCSEAPKNRYDQAIDLAKSYSLVALPKDLQNTFGDPKAKNVSRFYHVPLNPSFSGKFEAAAQELLKQKFLQEGNAELLTGIVDNFKRRCAYGVSTLLSNVDCGEGSLAYMADEVRLLHTSAGDFVVSSADVYRGNGSTTNENASALVLAVDPTDGTLGLIIEDKVAINGERREAMAAALTLASSLQRVTTRSYGKKPTVADILYDIQAAKSHTLFQKPAPVPQPATAYEPPASPSSHATLTKDELRELVLGKSMAEVRALFGSPSNLDQAYGGIAWFYWASKLPVMDTDAGIAVGSTAVVFSPATKTAVEVRFL